MKFSGVNRQELRPFQSNRYLRAAAVLCYFDPSRIRPAGTGREETRSEAFQDLLAASTITYDKEKQPQWTLRSDIRRQVLADLQSPESLLALLDANPDRPRNTLQRVLEAYIQGTNPSLEDQNLEELSSTLQVIEWLDGVLSNLPNVEDVQLRIERETMLQSFRELADQHFQGRTSELTLLRNYVGALPSETVYESLSRGVRRILSLNEKPPLLIYGPGGMGKSTLVARFILEHAETTTSDQLPFIYLDFDRPSLLASEPLTLLADALNQLGVQFPSQRSHFMRLREDVLGALSQAARSGAVRSPSEAIQETYGWRVNDRVRRSLLTEFSNALFVVRSTETPVLLVLDTFEQVQLRSREFVYALWEFLNSLQERTPFMRVVLSGRAPVTDFKTEECELKPLDAKSARAVLESHGFPRDVAAMVVRQVGGSPLSLWLAARILQKEGVSLKGLADLGGRRYLSRVKEDVVQGILYRRILGHVTDENAKKLAHPGLVLRRITPEIIRSVLAEPCGVVVRDAQHADELFQVLRSDMTLVKQADDGSLRHQPYMRSAMVRLLREDQPGKARELERRAVDFYQAYSDPVSRAEEIFHRLSLGESPEAVNSRWAPGVERYLTSEIEDLPRKAQAFLVARSRRELSKDQEKEASASDLERAAASRAGDLIELEKFDEALSFLHKQKKLPPSIALLRLKARALMGLQRFEEARNVLRKALSRDVLALPDDSLLDMYLSLAELDARLGWTDPADRVLDEFELLSRHFPRDLRTVEFGVIRMESWKSASPSLPPAESTEAFTKLDLRRNRVEDGFRGPMEVRHSFGKALSEYVVHVQEELINRPDLCRRLIAVLGEGFPEPARQLIRQVGIGKDLIRWMRRSLPAFLAEWDKVISPGMQNEAGPLLQAAGVHHAPEYPEGVWAEMLQERGIEETAKLVDFLLARFDLPVQLVPRLAALMKEAIRGSRERGMELA